jgi:hypothetical protein
MKGLKEFSDLSDQLLGYFEMLEKETGSEIVLRYVEWEPSDDPGATLRFDAVVIASSSTIEIEVDRENGLSKTELEHRLAHEATHGYLQSGKGYYRAYLRYHPSHSYEREMGTIMSSIMDDIVVSRALADHGMSPFSATYLEEVKRAMKEARKNPNYYPSYPEFPEFRELWIAFRSVLAWGIANYVDLPAETKELLNRFVKGTQQTSLHAYKMAQQVDQIIQRYDIFNSEGHKSALEELIQLWDLGEDFVLYDVS